MSLLSIWLALVAANPVGVASAADIVDPKAEEVVARSRTTTATYTIYWRVQISDGGAKPNFAWGATFRKGTLVRVEDTGSRAVADCATMKGFQSVVSIGNEHSNGHKIAQHFCGIDSDRRVRSARWLGQKQGEFGLVDEVQIIDEEGTFIYQVAADGALMGVSSTSRVSGFVVVAEPMSFDLRVPAGDLFSKMSLASSRVPKVIQSQASRPIH